VLTHATLKPTTATKASRRYWKRNADQKCDVSKGFFRQCLSLSSIYYANQAFSHCSWLGCEWVWLYVYSKTGSKKLRSSYPAPLKLCTPYSRNQVPLTFETRYLLLSKPCTLHPKLETMYPVLPKSCTSTRDLTSGITHQCFKSKIKFLIFQHK